MLLNGGENNACIGDAPHRGRLVARRLNKQETNQQAGTNDPTKANFI